MGMQTTFVMVKPDGVQRGLVGNIIQRFENKGLRLVGLRQLTPSLELAESHYAVHSERPFYSGLIEFITSSHKDIIDVNTNDTQDLLSFGCRT